MVKLHRWSAWFKYQSFRHHITERVVEGLLGAFEMFNRHRLCGALPDAWSGRFFLEFAEAVQCRCQLVEYALLKDRGHPFDWSLWGCPLVARGERLASHGRHSWRSQQREGAGACAQAVPQGWEQRAVEARPAVTDPVCCPHPRTRKRVTEMDAAQTTDTPCVGVECNVTLQRQQSRQCLL